MKEVRSVGLNVCSLSGRKDRILDELLVSCLGASEHLCETLRFWDVVFDGPVTRFNLQKIEYTHIREKYGLPSQIAVDVIKDAFSMYHTTGGIHTSYPIPYNVPRSGGFSVTKRGHPVMRVYTKEGRLALPISVDGSYERYRSLTKDGYGCTAFKLQKTDDGWSIILSLTQEWEPTKHSNVMVGVDVGCRTLASVVVIDLDTEKILEQHYFGRDVWERQRDISIRRSMLQSHNRKGPHPERARKKLDALDRQEHNFTKTRCYQVAHEIIDLAKKYGGSVAIEELTYLHRNTRKSRKKTNRKTKRMPYNTLRVALESIGMRELVPLIVVNPHNTSMWCPRCGHLGVRIYKYAVFYCDHCKRIVNADRNAGLNIAIRAGTSNYTPVFGTQISDEHGLVNGHLWQDEEGDTWTSQVYIPPDCKPTASAEGN